MRMPIRRRSARSRSIRPTRRKPFAGAFPRTIFSSSSWWSAAAPTGWRRPAARTCVVTFFSFPVISTTAPLGARGRSMLDRYFRSGSGVEIGSGRASPKLLASFAPSSMTLASGLTDADPGAALRGDVCHFSDDRLPTAQKLDFVHRLLGRDMAEVRMLLDRIEKYVASISEAERRAPSVVD